MKKSITDFTNSSTGLTAASGYSAVNYNHTQRHPGDEDSGGSSLTSACVSGAIPLCINEWNPPATSPWISYSDHFTEKKQTRVLQLVCQRSHSYQDMEEPGLLSKGTGSQVPVLRPFTIVAVQKCIRNTGKNLRKCSARLFNLCSVAYV